MKAASWQLTMLASAHWTFSAKHQPYEIDPAIEKELDEFRQMVASRDLQDFYLYETEEKQDFATL